MNYVTAYKFDRYQLGLASSNHSRGFLQYQYTVKIQKLRKIYLFFVKSKRFII